MESQAARYLDKRVVGSVAAKWLGRPFRANTKLRVLIYANPGDISRSQIEPFFQYAGPLKERFGAQFRCLNISDFLDANPGPDADVVLIQPWFDVPGETIARGFEALRARLPAARFVFLDSFAHNDLRLGRFVDEHIDFYFKKSIFRDRSEYLLPRPGDTNLTEFYGALYDLDMGGAVDWNVPKTILPKLRLSPNFFTLDRFHRAFGSGLLPELTGREIDVQSRLGARGSVWYGAMRKDAQSKIEGIAGLTLSPPGTLNIQAFMAELANAKLCFSPFGYGELCWRDIEAFQTGAVLVKPDMGHLETLPDLYEAGVTYLAVRWDFSDLEDVVRGALADENRLQKIAREAWARTARYVREGCFVDDMAEMFEGLVAKG